jgi:hypothetical protein
LNRRASLAQRFWCICTGNLHNGLSLQTPDIRQHPEGGESLTSQTETLEIELVSLETDEEFQELSESEGCELPISERETSDIEVVPFETDEDFKQSFELLQRQTPRRLQQFDEIITGDAPRSSTCINGN